MDYIAHQAPLFMGILQARILEWVVNPSSRGSSQSRDWSQVPHLVDSLISEPPGKSMTVIQLVHLVWMCISQNSLNFHTDHSDLYGTTFPEGRRIFFFPYNLLLSSCPEQIWNFTLIVLTNVSPLPISELKPGIHSYNIWLKENVIIEERWRNKIS